MSGLSIREQLESAFEDKEEPEAVVADAVDHDAPAPEGADQPEAISAKPEPVEKPAKERVVKAGEQPEKAAKAPPVVEEQKPAVAEKAAKQPPVQDAEAAAPGFLSVAGKGKWAALDPILKREFKKYERDQGENGRKLHEEMSRIKPEYDEISRAFAPYRDTFARRGMSPAQVTHQLLALANQADTDPVGFIKEQMRMRGITAEHLADGPGQSEGDPKIRELETELKRVQSYIQNTQEQSNQQTQHQVKTTVLSFQNAANEDGSPKHPHFDRVRTKMGALMSADDDLSIEAAYEQACYADPEIRKAVLAETQAEAERVRLANLKRSQNAGKSTLGGTAGRSSGGLPAGSSIRAQLTHAFDKYEGEARI